MNISQLKKLSLLCFLALITAACASNKVKTVPLRVQSDPLGAYVLFQVQADVEDQRNFDWVYIGNTPLDTRRSVWKKDLENADAFVLRIMKEGYIDQQKAYTGEQLVNEAKSKGVVFWNPRLVPAN